MRYLPIFFICILSARPAVAQTDSIIVTGRIRNLSARLYRESPTVLISRNNILQASRELVRPAPLNVDGTFRVALPLIYPQEEMYFNYGRIATAFLAAPGTLSIELNADSLFTAAVPFRFGGVNALVNSQFARYKAFEAVYPDRPDARKLSNVVGNLVDDKAVYRYVSEANQAPFRAFAGKEKPFPLVTRWVESVNRYNAAAFVYDKAAVENETVPKSLTDSLRPAGDRLLTAARASALNRFASYCSQRITAPEVGGSGRNGGLTVRTLSGLLIRYGRNLTNAERTRLRDYMEKNTARESDLRFFNTLIQRSSDTIQRLVNYELMLQRSRTLVDSAAVPYLAAYWLASALPGLTLDMARLLYAYAQPSVTDPYLKQSLDELYRLEVKDSVRVRLAVQTLQKAGTQLKSVEISPGVFVTRDALADGRALLDQLVNANRGKVIYVLLTSPDSEAGRQAALDAQRLRAAYPSRDMALLYLPNASEAIQLWIEFSAKQSLEGDHLLTTSAQLSALIGYLRPNDELSATVINRVGKVVKRNAPLPGAFEELRKVVDKNL